MTKDTIVAYAVPVNVNSTLQIPPLPEDIPPQGVVQNLPSALQSPSKSTVTGEIVKVSSKYHGKKYKKIKKKKKNPSFS